MRERVVIKWGGGLITQKDRMKTVRTDVLDHLADQLESCITAGLDVVLVHGAGSFWTPQGQSVPAGRGTPS